MSKGNCTTSSKHVDSMFKTFKYFVTSSGWYCSLSYDLENSGYRSARKRKIVIAHRKRRQYKCMYYVWNSSRHLSFLSQLHSHQNWSATSKHFTGFPESLHEFYSIPPWQTPNWFYADCDCIQCYYKVMPLIGVLYLNTLLWFV